jgi:hypothetical protein
MTLTDFILQRIAEDEAAAREAIRMRDRIDFIRPPEVPDLAFEAWEDAPVPFVAVGPERVLAECEAKRRIVKRAQRASEAFRQSINPVTSGVAMTMDLVLTDLALPYADHPDYREEWRP